MGERSRFSLPSLGLMAARAGAPSVDEARVALGGRVSTEPGAGSCVSVTMKRGAAAIGVLVCLNGDERDVWIGDGRFVRVTAKDVSVLVEVESSLLPVAADATLFGALMEGEYVIYVERRGIELPGTLAEKCRYGALVSTAEKKIVAVSFRRLRMA